MDITKFNMTPGEVVQVRPAEQGEAGGIPYRTRVK